MVKIIYSDWFSCADLSMEMVKNACFSKTSAPAENHIEDGAIFSFTVNKNFFLSGCVHDCVFSVHRPLLILVCEKYFRILTSVMFREDNFIIHRKKAH